MNRIIIYVEGGNIQAVRADNPDVEIIIVDADNMEAEGRNGKEIDADWRELTQSTKAVY